MLKLKPDQNSKKIEENNQKQVKQQDQPCRNKILCVLIE